MSHLQSSGRGGAGNIRDSSNTPQIQAEDLQTPTLKTAVVTTGRGGSGNMAKNSDPAETRLRQDVEPVIRRPSHGATHVGRGGTGNVFVPGSDDDEAARRELERPTSAISDGSAKKSEERANEGWAEKGKNFLFGRK